MPTTSSESPWIVPKRAMPTPPRQRTPEEYTGHSTKGRPKAYWEVKEAERAGPRDHGHPTVRLVFEAKKLAPIVIAEPVMHGSAVVGGCIRVTASIAEVHVRVVTADHGGPIAPHVAVVVLASAEP